MSFANYIQQITDTAGTTHDLVDTSASHYIKGTQTGSTNAWTGALPDGVTAYYDGLAIDYFLPFAGTSTGATLNLGGKGAKPVYRGNSPTSAVTTHFPALSVIHMTYIINSSINSGNGAWIASAYYDSTYYTESCYVSTKASTAAKVGTVSNYALQKGHLQVLLMNANTAASALTLNVNSTGAKPIYINGAVSSSSNYTLPKAMYLVYYDGTNFHFRTDGIAPGGIAVASSAKSDLIYNKNTLALVSDAILDQVIDTIGLSRFVGVMTCPIGIETSSSYSGAPLSASSVYFGTAYFGSNGSIPDYLKVTLYKVGDNSDSIFAYYNPTYDEWYWNNGVNSHTHGNIQNGGALQSSDITIANGDKLVVTDSSDSNKVARASISFDGSTTTQCLTKKGTWASFTNNAGTITGSGTSGYIAKWNGGSSITNGPQFGSDSAKYLRNDGTWAVPPGEGGMAEDLTELTGVTSLSVLETKLNEVLSTMPDSGAAKKVRGIYVDSTITTSPFAQGTYEGWLFKQANVAAGGGACILWTTGLQSTQTMIVGHKSGGTWGNWSSYFNTDAKLQVAAVTSGTTYYPIVGTGTTAATRQFDTTGFTYKGTNGTTSAVGGAVLTLGNSTASGTANNKQGQVVLYGSTAYATTITPGSPTAARTITLPNASGTVSLDGHTHVVALNNGQLTSTYKFFIVEYQDQFSSGIKSTCVMPNNGVAVSFSYITQIAEYTAHYFVTFQASISSNTLTFSNATGTWIVQGDVGGPYQSATPPTITAIWGVK